MEERGFDALQTGKGPAILIIATLLLLAIIFAGGMFFRYKELQWRAEHKDEEEKRRDDAARHRLA